MATITSFTTQKRKMHIYSEAPGVGIYDTSDKSELLSSREPHFSFGKSARSTTLSTIPMNKELRTPGPAVTKKILLSKKTHCF
jgi:hypothetical protein